MSAPTQLTPYRYWSDTRWEDLGINPNVSARLAKVDRALHGMGAIQELLAMSFDASQAEEDDRSPDTLRLSPSVQEGLNAAAITLFFTAADAMTALRDNEHNCWGQPA
jgi:hypothetical protein